MRTTSDFARRNRLLGAYVGGLNFQVEHHLFPKVCSVHYPALSRIVEDCARRHGLPYHDQPSVFRAVASHWRAMRRLGTTGGPGERLPAPAAAVDSVAAEA
jgi:linoleoyl-CoA desaturase